MRSPRLTNIGGGVYDLKLENGKQVWCEDGTQVAQHALERLQIFYGESDSHPKLGTKYFQIILDSSKSRAETDLEFKRVILGTTGAKKVVKFKYTQDGHTLNIDGAVQTDWGVVDISEALELL